MGLEVSIQATCPIRCPLSRPCHVVPPCYPVVLVSKDSPSRAQSPLFLFKRSSGHPSPTMGRKAKTRLPIPCQVPLLRLCGERTGPPDHPCEAWEFGAATGVPHMSTPAQPAIPMLQALVEIPHVVPPIWPLQGSPGTQEVCSIRPPGPAPDSCMPRVLKVPPFLYSSFFQLDFLLT